MIEPPDVYTDQFQLTMGPFGCSLCFSLSSPTPPAPGTAPQAERLASVRMSLEHLKVMAYILRHQMREYERKAGVQVQVPMEVLNSLHIGREDWDMFWKE